MDSKLNSSRVFLCTHQKSWKRERQSTSDRTRLPGSGCWLAGPSRSRPDSVWIWGRDETDGRTDGWMERIPFQQGCVRKTHCRTKWKKYQGRKKKAHNISGLFLFLFLCSSFSFLMFVSGLSGSSNRTFSKSIPGRHGFCPPVLSIRRRYPCSKGSVVRPLSPYTCVRVGGMIVCCRGFSYPNIPQPSF